ncbi:hypothetical protein Prudu_005616 [Prunus dulcis]|uniref:Uncharacterized protein n=1 Tax=Prunus dulcis TaxID=3755 RepID=A0A4Y1QY24_PRUDU|nr:hypothetical protein Prudu_005616 [Prunus dulcis]
MRNITKLVTLEYVGLSHFNAELFLCGNVGGTFIHVCLSKAKFFCVMEPLEMLALPGLFKQQLAFKEPQSIHKLDRSSKTT